jgi:hypothetical protein
VSSLPGAGPSVVPPAPLVQGTGNASGDARLSSMAGAGPQVVPPPPSVQDSVDPAGGMRSVGGAGNSGAGARIGSLSGYGSQIVPPPPAVGSASTSGSGVRLGSLSGEGSQIVPPPPAVGSASTSGSGVRLGSLSGDGSQNVPPPPAVGGAGIAGAGRHLGSLSGDGSQIVPPPPAVGDAGNSGAGARLGSLSGGGAETVSPPPALGSTGGTAKATDAQPVVASSPAPKVNNEGNPSVEELPLESFGLVFAPPGTSYFSNFEVFVARRRIGKGQLELIKLVYEFLPYQRRLSEYDLNNLPPRVVKLRVTPDSSCNEPLGRMIEPHANPTRSAPVYPKLPEELRSADLTALLPCYRTTAEDFQKAMLRGR